MNRLLLHTILPLLGLASVACSKREAANADAGDTGTLRLSIAAPHADAAADADYDPREHLTLRLYNDRDELIRKYTEQSLPERLELIAGRYTARVEAGESVAASYEKRFYVGEWSDEVPAGGTVRAEVVCKLQNAEARVRFDASVAETFGDAFCTWVAAADTFDAVASGSVPALEFKADGSGFFTLPEGVATLVAHFEGTHPERGTIVHDATFRDVKPGGLYSLAYKFSPDLPGLLECFLLTVDPSTENRDDTIVFSPDPTVEGDGFAISEVQDFIPGTTAAKRYRIASMKALQGIEIRMDGVSLGDALNGTIPGVVLTREGDLASTLAFEESFFAACAGGPHKLEFRITDAGGADVTAASNYRIQGILPVERADYDLWTNRITLRALVLDPNASTVVLGLRRSDGAWHDLTGTAAGDGIHTATFGADWQASTNEAGLTVHTPVAGTGVFADQTYEARVAIDGTTGTTAFAAAAGQIIPDGDMENTALPCFAKDQSTNTPFWGSGNAATSGLCTSGTKEGMGGAHCAVLQSQSAFNMLAAGNLFSATFKFASLKGTVGFGMPYAWEARPTALRVKYHATVGAVNSGTITSEHEYISDGQDRARIYVAIVDWNTRHETSSGMGNPTDPWDPIKGDRTNEGAVIAYGSLLIDQTTPGDAMIPVDIPIVYYDPAAKPSGTYTLVISCATSAYGDYKVGCLGNVMYVDDFQWVY